MSFMDKIKSWFSGDSSADDHAHDHDHDGHDHDHDHDHEGHEHAAADPMMAADPTGMTAPPMTAPDPMTPMTPAEPAEPAEPERREDL